MKFSIITPCFNAARYIREALESVAAQSGVEVEHLLCDGGSTDGTLEIIREFPNAQLVSSSDNGMSDAINRGFDQASGDWVMWLNADDRLKPGALSAVASSDLAGVDVAFGSFDFIHEDGSFDRRVKVPCWSRFVTVQHCCYVPSTATFYRRESVVGAGFRLRTDFRYLMDSEFQIRLADEGLTFRLLPWVLADFRFHDGNTSQRLLAPSSDLGVLLDAEKQHAESRALRRAHGLTFFRDPYLNGLVDGFAWFAGAAWKQILKAGQPEPREP